MIQTEEEFSVNVFKLKELASSSLFIQKIYSTPHFLCITIRGPGETHYLYIGRGKGYRGIWFGKALPPAEYRLRDHHLEYWRKNICSMRVSDFDFIEPLSAVLMSFKSGHYEGAFCFFYHNSILKYCNFLNDLVSKNSKTYFCWGKKIEVNSVINKDDFLSFQEKYKIQKDKNSFSKLEEQKIEDVLKKDYLLYEGVNEIKKERQFLKRKIEKIKKDLEKNCSWREIKNDLENFDYDLIREKLKNKVENILNKKIFVLNNNKNSYEEKNYYYELVKKLKNGEKISKERLSKTEEEFRNGLIQNTSINKLIDQNYLRKFLIPMCSDKIEITVKNNQDYLKKDYKEFTLKSGIRIAIGLNDEGNQWLRSNWAKKGHWWFHLNNVASAHLFIKIETLEELNEMDWDIIGSLLADYSKIKDEKISILYTQVKNLKAIKGQVGKVIYKKEKIRAVSWVESWNQFIDS